MLLPVKFSNYWYTSESVVNLGKDERRQLRLAGNTRRRHIGTQCEQCVGKSVDQGTQTEEIVSFVTAGSRAEIKVKKENQKVAQSIIAGQSKFQPPSFDPPRNYGGVNKEQDDDVWSDDETDEMMSRIVEDILNKNTAQY